MMIYFFLISVLGCMMSYVSVDPMKSSFFLIFSMLCGMPLLSFLLHVWFSYFICLLFLSGIFVILVYFSSLSKFVSLKGPWFYICFFLVVLFFFPGLFFGYSGFSMVNFYYDVYWYMFFWVVFSLVFFMNFTSYFLSFSGALRKV